MAKFVGDIIAQHPDYDDRVRLGKGGYAVYLGNGLVLDCFESAGNGRCSASKANDPRHCFDTVTGKMAEANCVLAIRGTEVRLRVKVGHHISAGSELSYAYGTTANGLLE